MSTSHYSLRELIRADIGAARRHFDGVITHLFPNLFVPISHRLAHALDERGLRWAAQLLAIACHVLTGAEIRPGACIGPGLTVIHPTGIVIGSDVVAGRDLALWGSNTIGFSEVGNARHRGSPRLGNGVILLNHASVIGPVSVGDRVVVGAYSLVLDDMPTESRPKGVPARTL